MALSKRRALSPQAGCGQDKLRAGRVCWTWKVSCEPADCWSHFAIDAATHLFRCIKRLDRRYCWALSSDESSLSNTGFSKFTKVIQCYLKSNTSPIFRVLNTAFNWSGPSSWGRMHHNGYWSRHGAWTHSLFAHLPTFVQHINPNCLHSLVEQTRNLTWIRHIIVAKSINSDSKGEKSTQQSCTPQEWAQNMNQ